MDCFGEKKEKPVQLLGSEGILKIFSVWGRSNGYNGLEINFEMLKKTLKVFSVQFLGRGWGAALVWVPVRTRVRPPWSSRGPAPAEETKLRTKRIHLSKRTSQSTRKRFSFGRRNAAQQCIFMRIAFTQWISTHSLLRRSTLYNSFQALYSTRHLT